APKVKDVRALTDYGFSFIYVIFEDNTDIYWTRTRVLEYLSKVITDLKVDAEVEIGPDATGLGWIFQYALLDKSGKYSLEEIRAFQDFYLKYEPQSVKGVAEVASIGGFVKQYQIIVDPNKLNYFDISINDIADVIKRSNLETGARLVEFSGREYMITVRRYINSLKDIENLAIKVNSSGVPIRIRDVAEVKFGPDIRRGLADLDGMGEVVGGIVIMRYKENALEVINRIKEKIKEIKLPEGLELVVTYDRSDFILKAIDTLKRKLIEEKIVVSLVIIIFLLHIPSSVSPIITLPISVVLSFIPLYYLKVTSNIMSLGGIAITLGALSDATVAIIENVHKKISTYSDKSNIPDDLIINAIKEVARPSFFTLLVMAISFIPVLALESIEGRLFKPLAYAKIFVMFFSAIPAITLTPALITALIRTKKLK
ncbi:MAG: efflux RND transporter permease subunit, partial [Candidatus Hydrothermales bacterium]